VPYRISGKVRAAGAALACPVVAAAIFALACASSRETRVVTVPDPNLRPVFFLEAITDDRTAVATVAAIVERDLGFPSFPVTFRFYPTRQTFEQALVESGHDPELARTTAGTMSAVGGYRGVILNSEALDRMSWTGRIGLLAHELGHSLQYELGGGRRGTSDQWLREGFAEWLSVRVLERLDAAEMAAVRRVRQRELSAAGQSRTPRLDELVTFPQWVQAGERFGSTAYALAFLAVDSLLERHRVEGVVDYFRRFASTQDRIANFRAAFGEDLDAFESSLGKKIGYRVPPGKRQSSRAPGVPAASGADAHAHPNPLTLTRAGRAHEEQIVRADEARTGLPIEDAGSRIER
jgi:hypothetical protein